MGRQSTVNEHKVMTREKYSEFIRFVVVGVFATILHYAIYWLLKNWLNYNVAYTIGYGLSFICNYYLTAHFTFRTKATAKRGIGFGAAHLFNYLFQMCLLNVFLSMGVSQNVAPVPVYAIAVPVQFMLVRFVFKNKGNVHSVVF